MTKINMVGTVHETRNQQQKHEKNTRIHTNTHRLGFVSTLPSMFIHDLIMFILTITSAKLTWARNSGVTGVTQGRGWGGKREVLDAWDQVSRLPPLKTNEFVPLKGTILIGNTSTPTLDFPGTFRTVFGDVAGGAFSPVVSWKCKVALWIRDGWLPGW